MSRITAIIAVGAILVLTALPAQSTPTTLQSAAGVVAAAKASGLIEQVECLYSHRVKRLLCRGFEWVRPRWS